MLNLNYQKIGNGYPLIILHGLYGSLHNWLTIGKALAPNFEVWLIDQRNHGHSPHHAEHTYNALQADLLNFMNQHKIAKAHILGHSMGGKTAMYFSLQHPNMVKSLIVADIAPKAYTQLNTPSQHSIQHLNIINTMLSINLQAYSTRAQIEADFTNALSDKRIAAFLLKNLTRNAQGNFEWLLNINAIHNQLPYILQGINVEDFKHLRDQLQFPVLFLKGEKSDYINESDLYKIKELYPQAEITTIFDSGHWLHAEQPALFLKSVQYFLNV